MGRDTRRCDPCGHPARKSQGPVPRCTVTLRASRRVQSPAAPSPCAQVAGSSPPLHRHPARKSQGPVPRCTVTLRASRRVQSPAAPSPCAQVAGSSPPLHRHPARKSQGPVPRCTVTLRASRRVQSPNRVVQRLLLTKQVFCWTFTSIIEILGFKLT